MPKIGKCPTYKFGFTGDFGVDAKSRQDKNRPKFYPTEDVVAQPKSTFKPGPTKLRASITPGTVLILLAGRFRGKRVIFLKQLESGTLLVTGPFKINGVPLRRVNQAYVIATSTKVKVPKVDVTDATFARAAAAKGEGEDAFFANAASKVETSDERKALQTKVDGGIKLDSEMEGYLKAKFRLTKGMKPHLMSF